MAEDSAAHPDGYVVTPAELVQAAQHIARLADRVAGIVQPPAAVPDHDREPHPPGSNAEAEQDWRADGARALAALRADSHALAATGAAYLAADRDAAALLGRCGQLNRCGDRPSTPTTAWPQRPSPTPVGSCTRAGRERSSHRWDWPWSALESWRSNAGRVRRRPPARLGAAGCDSPRRR